MEGKTGKLGKGRQGYSCWSLGPSQSSGDASAWVWTKVFNLSKHGASSPSKRLKGLVERRGMPRFGDAKQLKIGLTLIAMIRLCEFGITFDILCSRFNFFGFVVKESSTSVLWVKYRVRSAVKPVINLTVSK